MLLTAIALCPVYVFDSGGVQPGHALFFLAFLSHIFSKQAVPRAGWTAGVALIVFVYGRELASQLHYPEFSFPKAPLFIAFNVLICVFSRDAFARSGVNAFAPGFLAAGLVAGISIALSQVGVLESRNPYRPTGLFNNPNQLGYFGCCLLAFSLIPHGPDERREHQRIAIAAIALYIILISLSKAAILAAGAALALGVPQLIERRSHRWLGLTLILAGSVLSAEQVARAPMVADAVTRLASIGEQEDDSLEGRGYGALAEFGAIEALIGVGTAGVADAMGPAWDDGLEIHSTLGAHFGAYGLIGLLLLFSFFWSLLRHSISTVSKRSVLAIAIAPLIYGLAHNGIRFTFAWILLAAWSASSSPGRRLPKGSGQLHAE